MRQTTLASRRRKAKKPEKTEQLNVRFPVDILERIDRVAEALTSNASQLVRLMVMEKLPEYEARAEQIRGPKRS